MLARGDQAGGIAMINRFTRASCFALALLLTPISVLAQSTVTTYQGQLKSGGSPANGNHDFVFSLCSTAAGPGGVLQTFPPAGTVTVNVTGGLFTQELTFDTVHLSGAERWLEIEVNGTILAPRQHVTFAPYAAFAARPWVSDGANISYPAGNVGVGVATPSRKLSVGGGAVIDYAGLQDGALQANALVFGGPTSQEGIISKRTSGGNQFGLDFFTNSFALGPRMSITWFGNVGIGTTAPSARLHVSAPAAGAGDNTAHFSAPVIGPNDSHIHFGTNGDWYIRSARATGKVVLQDSGGNVGIGTSSPTGKLDVRLPGPANSAQDGVRVELQQIGPFPEPVLRIVTVLHPVNGGYPRLAFSNDGVTNDILISCFGDDSLAIQGGDVGISTGNLGVGVTFPQERLHVAGRLLVTDLPFGDHRNVQWDDVTGVFHYDNSSRRHKENIGPLEDDFARLLDARPVTYTRPGAPQRWEIGFIAEDFHDLGLTRLVDYNAAGEPDGVNYEKVCLYLTEIAKQQRREIESLRNQNDELSARLDRLEALVLNHAAAPVADQAIVLASEDRP
jgi:hypothetical protein